MCPSNNIKNLFASDESPPQEVNHDLSEEDFQRYMDLSFNLFERNHQTIIKKIQINKELVMRDIDDKDEHAFGNIAPDLLYNKCLLDATNSLHVKISTLFDEYRSDQNRTYSTNLYCAYSMIEISTKVHERIFNSINSHTGDC